MSSFAFLYPDAEAHNGDGAEAFRLEVMTARETCALPDPPIENRLVGPLVERGSRTLLGGHTGEGKTTLALQLARAVAHGGTFLEWEAAGDERVLVIDAEQGVRTVKRRLREAGLGDSENVDYCRVPDGLALDSDVRHRDAVEEALSRHDYALVIADPLYKLHRGDSTEERAAVDLMRVLDAWRIERNFALVLPMHPRKRPPGKRGPITRDDLFGSAGWTWGAEVIAGIQRTEPGRAHLHFFKDRDGDLPPVGTKWGLLFDQAHGFRRDPDDGKAKETNADKVRAKLEAGGYRTKQELAEAIGTTVRSVEAGLKDLGDDVGSDGKKPAHYWLRESE